MKLLFDENLSPKLVQYLQAEYPASAHVAELGLGSDSDREVWHRAAEGGYTIVSKDTDFRDFSLLYGAPPKVIIVALGNCATKDVADLLRTERAEIETFAASYSDAILVLHNL